MSGRGDNNKHGSSGRGASNQSNQGARDESEEISKNIEKVQKRDNEQKKNSSGSADKKQNKSS